VNNCDFSTILVLVCEKMAVFKHFFVKCGTVWFQLKLEVQKHYKWVLFGWYFIVLHIKPDFCQIPCKKCHFCLVHCFYSVVTWHHTKIWLMNYIEKFGQVFSRISVVCWFLFYNLPSISMLCDWQMAWCMALIAISVFMYRVSQKNPPPLEGTWNFFIFLQTVFNRFFYTPIIRSCLC